MDACPYAIKVYPEERPSDPEASAGRVEMPVRPFVHAAVGAEETAAQAD